MASKKKLNPKPKKKSASKKQIPSFLENKASLLYILSVLVLTFVLFYPSLSHGFVNWDDDMNVLKNPYVQTLSWDNIIALFSPKGLVLGNYNPLTIFSFALESHFWGIDENDAFHFHFINLLLHLGCIFFVFQISKQLGLGNWGATLVALLFAIHPMRVESVVWITERKDVLFGIFYLAAMFTYMRYLKLQEKKWYVFTFLLFMLSLLSKIQAVSLPLSLIVLDYYLKKDIHWKILIDKIPFFLGALIIGSIGLKALEQEGSLVDATHYSFFERLLVGGWSYCNYFVKCIFPFEMSPLYPYPKAIPWYFNLTAFASVIVLLGTFYAFLKKKKAVVFGLAFFTVNVMFVLQILGAGQGFLADRFTYIPYFGLFFLFAFGLDYLIKKHEKLKWPIVGVVIMYLGLFSFMTIQQSKIWKNGYELWTHTLNHYDYISTPWTNLGHYYRDSGDFQKALEKYNYAISISPKAETLNSRGKLKFDHGQTNEAIQDYSKAIEIEPNAPFIPEIYTNRGAAYGSLGQYDLALLDFNKGLELKPNFKNGLSNRSMLYYAQGRFDLALLDYDAYLRLDSTESEIFYERGIVRNILNQSQGALQDFNKAISMKSDKGLFYLERAKVYRDLGNNEAAYQDALKATTLGVNVSSTFLESLK